MIKPVYSCRGIGDFEPCIVDTLLVHNHFAVIRGVIDPLEVASSLENVRLSFEPDDDHPTQGELPSQIRDNFQKIAAGTSAGKNGAGNFARLIRIIYSPFFVDDKYGIHNVLRQTAIIRNRLYGLEDTFALGVPIKGVWTAARVQQYPAGGGFLSAHTDSKSVAVSEKIANRYLQLLLVMTQRGRDFEQGGAFIEVDGRSIDIEDCLQCGDILVYDARARHGVRDIDPHRRLDLQKFNGRVVGLVNLYTAQ